MTEDEKLAEGESAPAVHSDELWGGPRWIEHAQHEPVWVETKEQYFDLLNRRGLHMKHQAESTTGPVRDPDPIILPPPIVVPPMHQDEAHVYGAITAVFRRYGLIETLWCEDCFAAGRPHGCRMRVTDHDIILECRCGFARYQPPTGTTDLVLRSLTTSSIVELDKTLGTILTPNGPLVQPVVVLQAQECLIIRRYMAALRARAKFPRLFHTGCFSGDPRKESEALHLSIRPDQIVILCRCRQLYAKGVIH